MEDKSRTQLTSIFFISFSIVFSFLFWSSIEKIVRTYEVESWFQLILYFSIFFISWSLGVILAKDNGWLRLTLLIPLFSGVYFVLNWRYLVIIVLAGLLTWLAIMHIKKEIDARITISVWHSLRAGKILFIIAIAFIMSSHYYFNHPKAGENIVEIKLGKQQTWIAAKIISIIDPDLSVSEMNDLTIDDFIKRKIDIGTQLQSLQIEEKIRDEGEIPNGMWDGLTGGINIDKLEEELILQENRKGISEMVGEEVKGDEKMIDVVLSIVSGRLNEMIAPKKDFSGPTGLLIPWLISLIVFLSVTLFGIVISPILIFVAWVLFKILIELKLVTINKKETMLEIIS